MKHSRQRSISVTSMPSHIHLLPFHPSFCSLHIRFRPFSCPLSSFFLLTPHPPTPPPPPHPPILPPSLSPARAESGSGLDLEQDGAGVSKDHQRLLCDKCVCVRERERGGGGEREREKESESTSRSRYSDVHSRSNAPTHRHCLGYCLHPNARLSAARTHRRGAVGGHLARQCGPF
jgi:hypothetical protein